MKKFRTRWNASLPVLAAALLLCCAAFGQERNIQTTDLTRSILQSNSRTSFWTKVAGPTCVFNQNTNAAILCGSNNVIQQSEYSAMGSGSLNNIVGSSYSFIGSGAGVGLYTSPGSAIGSGNDTWMTAGQGSFIGSGMHNAIVTDTTVNAFSYTDGAGQVVTSSPGYNGMGVGHLCYIGSNDEYAEGIYYGNWIGGGASLNMKGNATNCVIDGGCNNLIQAGQYAAILGGNSNKVSGRSMAIGWMLTNTTDWSVQIGNGSKPVVIQGAKITADGSGITNTWVKQVLTGNLIGGAVSAGQKYAFPFDGATTVDATAANRTAIGPGGGYLSNFFICLQTGTANYTNVVFTWYTNVYRGGAVAASPLTCTLQGLTGVAGTNSGTTCVFLPTNSILTLGINPNVAPANQNYSWTVEWWHQ